MRLADKVQEWLDRWEWDDVIDLDEENETSSVNFRFKIKDQSFEIFIETDEKKDLLKFYFYAPFCALPQKFIDCAVLFNHINAFYRAGSITLDADGNIRWCYFIGFQETDPSSKTINNAFGAGKELFDEWFDEISEVALTKTTWQEMMDRFNADSEKAVPDSIALTFPG
ncbi:MAG: YbjN domain-containing protein [Methylococcaceae bacterium]